MDNILQLNDYIITNNVPDIKINDKVIAFNNGINWVAVSLKVIRTYPIIYITFSDTKNSKISEMSLITCPYSCFSAVFDKNLLYKNNKLTHDKYGVIEITDKKNNDINLIEGYIKKNSKNIKRYEVNIMTLRDMMTLYPNIKFLVTKKENKKNVPADIHSLKLKHDIDYLVHPQTLVYVIEYKSSKINGYKRTAIIGSDASTSKYSGFSINNNGITKYMNNNDTTIRQKSGFIYPIFWFAVIKMYPNINVIRL